MIGNFVFDGVNRVSNAFSSSPRKDSSLVGCNIKLYFFVFAYSIYVDIAV